MLNIPSTVDDSKYRYKMPKMQLKIQSKGNGIKTNIVNLSDIAKSLQTQTEYILKFFGFEKASQTIFKQAGGKNNTNYIINGDFNYEELLKTLDKFIEKYICCPKCKLPELQMTIGEGKVHGKCLSCPFNGELDNKHRLAAFIIKKPPVIRNIGKKQKIELNTVDKKKHHKIHVDKYYQENYNVKHAAQLFSSDNMEFGSQQVTKLIIYIRQFLANRKQEDFDIKSAEVVEQLKPLGLKKSLIGYVLFNTFFTVNIAKQVEENLNLYLKLMNRMVSKNKDQVQLQSMLNLQQMLLEDNKQKDYKKFIPTIIHKLYETYMFTGQFLIAWAENRIPNISNNFFYNANRNAQFIKIAIDFTECLKEELEEQMELKKQQKQSQNAKNNQQETIQQKQIRTIEAQQNKLEPQKVITQ